MKLKNYTILPTMLAISMLHGCGEPRIDSTSDDAFKSSLSSVRASMTADQQKELDHEITSMIIGSVGDLFSRNDSQQSKFSELKTRLDGKTGKEALEEFKLMRIASIDKEKSIKDKEITDLKRKSSELAQRIAQAASAKTSLEKFKVLSSSFYFDKNSLLHDAIIEVTVKNDTSTPVATVYFSCTLSSPGRSVPWVSDDLVYQIPGGIEPGEQATWKLSPNMFSQWGNAPRDRNDLAIAITPYRLDGGDGAVILNSLPSKSDIDELERVKARITAISP
ncbi:DUF6694 family lipoprotein [Candidatus Thiothrix sp. Deng01]|uniref:DUF6694 family lipoprotein n=1 Tax=Candidatus Thiothrix phosphatis TaxID=3112415 RepID=A0ABU6CT29_9GAMM|nr:DUF6694 family lipoprotein [Candidatus Thiothrix sp. Deng01]MEB4589992.1 DUF6694 family lipoprotein [Candidatus Thiothrix sp. Deng01]